jgi:regulator of CtrA degradation
MSRKPESDTGAVSFSEHLANSQVFTVLFRDGMALVEETASYLDGPGRKESKRLQRSAALAYATESMRLTTRLMQIASWLLLHRAVKEGEMTLTQAKQEKVKVKLTSSAHTDEQTLATLPESLCDLIKRSHNVSDRVNRLDATIYAPPARASLAGNPVERQLGLLKAAFERSA